MTQKKLSEIIRAIPEKYNVIQSRLYEKAEDENKKCSVCVMGGIALTVNPERFVPASDYGLCDAKNGNRWIHVSDYRTILKEAGITDETINRNYTMPESGNEYMLMDFLFHLNDSGYKPQEIADILEKEYGL